MGLFDQFPYTNFHELNLMWILEALKEIQTTTEQFVAINSLKYANPIQWNIVQQYEKNTIVIDPLTGTAYISVQPVPTGVALTNEDYWTVVFDLGAFVTRAAKNFTTRWEADTTLTATFNSVAGDWLVWGDTLYKAIVNITAGDSYVIDSNIRRITIEEVKNNILQLISDNYDAIITMIGGLDDLTTTDKTNIVAAINELVLGLSNEVQARTDADNAINVTIGDLNSLETTNKTSIVNAINSAVSDLNNTITNERCFKNVHLFGAKGDGITDDTAAFNAAFSSFDQNGGTLYCNGRFLITQNITIPKNVVIYSDDKIFRGGEENEDLTNCNALLLNGAAITCDYNSAINNIAILNADIDYATERDSGNFTGDAIYMRSGAKLQNLGIVGFTRGIIISGNGVSLETLTIDCLACIDITTSYDCNYINNIHCWPLLGGWSGSQAEIDTNTHRSGTAIYIHGNADGTKMSNIFVFNHVCGISVFETADQEYSNLSFDKCGVGFYGVRAENISVSNLRTINCPVGIGLEQTSITIVGGSVYRCATGGIMFNTTSPVGDRITYANISAFKFRNCGNALYFSDIPEYMAKVNLSDVTYEYCTAVYNYVHPNYFVNVVNDHFGPNDAINVTSNEPPVLPSASTLLVPNDFHFAVVSGTTTIDDITRDAHSGDKITLLFNEPLTINDGAHLSVGGTLNVTAKQVIEFVNFRGVYYIA